MNIYTNQDEELFIPEAMHNMMMQVEAARIECNRMQTELQRGFAEHYNDAPTFASDPIPVAKAAPRKSATIIDARDRFLARTAHYIQACLFFLGAAV